jgi:hypothetical protein
MIEAELAGVGVAYRSRPAVARATSAPLAWFGRARVAALLLVGGAVLPWSIPMLRGERAAIAFLLASILLSCAGTWLLTAGSCGFPFDQRPGSRIRGWARAFAATELVLSLCFLPTLVTTIKVVSASVWVPALLGVHVGAVITRLLALRFVQRRIGATLSARSATALLKGYLFSVAWLLVALAAAIFAHEFALIYASIGLFGLLVVHLLDCTGLLLGADGLRIVLEERWVRISSSSGQDWAVLALLRAGHALVLLPHEPPRAFESGVEAQRWLVDERYADPARVDTLQAGLLQPQNRRQRHSPRYSRVSQA